MQILLRAKFFTLHGGDEAAAFFFNSILSGAARFANFKINFHSQLSRFAPRLVVRFSSKQTRKKRVLMTFPHDDSEKKRAKLFWKSVSGFVTSNATLYLSGFYFNSLGLIDKMRRKCQKKSWQRRSFKSATSAWLTNWFKRKKRGERECREREILMSLRIFVSASLLYFDFRLSIASNCCGRPAFSAVSIRIISEQPTTTAKTSRNQ